MSETTEPDVSALPEPTAQGAVLAGAMLKKARESAGLHIGALAVGLKVPVNKLEALESGRLEALSGPVFVRALASSVCRTLKVDPTEILAQLPLASMAHLHQKGDLNEPFRGVDRSMNFSMSDRLLKPFGLAVAALIVGALLLLFWPQMREVVSSAESKSDAPLFPAPMAEAKPDDKVLEPVKQAVSAAEAAVTASAPVPSTTVATPKAQEVASTLPDVAANVADKGRELVAFKASAPSWVEVTDASGVVVLRKTLAAGEMAQAGGAAPLKAVVGRADVTEVTVRGQRLELQTSAKDNVARFEVK